MQRTIVTEYGNIQTQNYRPRFYRNRLTALSLGLRLSALAKSRLVSDGVGLKNMEKENNYPKILEH